MTIETSKYICSNCRKEMMITVGTSSNIEFIMQCPKCGWMVIKKKGVRKGN